MVPWLKRENLVSGVSFTDAQVDDARLVLRLITTGVAHGGSALNYTRVLGIQQSTPGKGAVVSAQGENGHGKKSFSAGAVINATGAWAEHLHPSPDKNRRIRPLRGSHLVFPGDLFPCSHGVSFCHPRDKRPVFIFPWEGCTVLGTTDIDHTGDMKLPPSAAKEEADYLMEGVFDIMPGLKISPRDCISSFAGVRPVLSRGGTAPSQESREHEIWRDNNLVTVTGGKLTTFISTARDALRAADSYLPVSCKKGFPPVFETLRRKERLSPLSEEISQRLYGRYGKRAESLVNNSSKDNLDFIPGTWFLWAELAHAAQWEKVNHLSDLLLRRVRLGLILPEGGKQYMAKIESVCRKVLPWDDKRWDYEKKAYEELWQKFYAPPF